MQATGPPGRPFCVFAKRSLQVDTRPKGDQMLRLKRITDAMKASADTLENLYTKTNGTPPDETAKLIKELRELTKEILTSQEFLNSKIKL